MAKIQLNSGTSEPVTVDVQLGAGNQFAGNLNGDRIEGTFQKRDDGNGLLRIGHRVMPCYFTRKDSHIEVWLGGEIYTFEVLTAKGRNTAAVSNAIAEEILAPMPGTVLRIEVNPGETFAAHQPLIIMESMKMEMTLSAPHAGRVGQIACTEGELVPMGKVLATLKPMESDVDVSAKS